MSRSRAKPMSRIDDSQHGMPPIQRSAGATPVTAMTGVSAPEEMSGAKESRQPDRVEVKSLRLDDMDSDFQAHCKSTKSPQLLLRAAESGQEIAP